MANSRRAFLTAAWRGLKGMAVGAGMVSVPPVTVMGILFGFDLIRTAAYCTRWMLEDELENCGLALSLVFVACLLVGGIAGLAARLPPKGMGMLKAIAVVAGCAVLAAVLAIFAAGLGWHGEGPPFALMALGAIVGGVIVLMCGISGSEASGGSSKVSTDKPSSHGEGHE
jgi:hypothetical protein